MECNKDEAARAKDISLRKFNEKDYVGAKKFALKAQTLDPRLDGIISPITLDVYISAEKKVGGEMDMYGVLGVDPLTDDDTLKKHYRKLLLQVHPDKNKSTGADGAFQLVTEAFNVLSDKAKRSAYNTRHHIKMAEKVPRETGIPQMPAGSRLFQQKVPTQAAASVLSSSSAKTVDQKTPAKGGVSGASRTAQQAATNPGSSASQFKVPSQTGNSVYPPGLNGHYNHSGSNSSLAKSRKRGRPRKYPEVQSFYTEGNTFWTVCARCKMQYEFMRVYLNKTLNCPHCKQGFIAIEIPPPSNLAPLQPQKQCQRSASSSGPSTFGTNISFGASSTRWNPFSGETAYSNLTSSSAGHAQATCKSQPARESLKRELEEAQMTGGWERSNQSGFVLNGDVSSRMKEMDDRLSWNSRGGIPSQPGTGNVEAGRANFSSGYRMKFDVNRELSPLELRKMLIEKAAVDIREKLQGWAWANEERAASKYREKVKGKLRLESKVKRVRSHSDSADTKEGSQLKKKISGTSADDAETESAGMSVPDPDFHVFDLDRSESCFGENQVWAGFDNTDGMPRFYALIHRVISLDPFEVEISWLNSKNSSEFDILDWVSHGFTKSCGEFRIGKHETNNLLNSFSHRVKWDKGPRGVIHIYPKKGDIWALYRHWSPDWDQNTPDDIVHVYDMFEVLNDYNEEHGVSVSPVVKVAGFRTVFCKQPDPKEVKQIPKEEMFRFSHQVPSHILIGDEKPNAPKGYVELDPASTPAELLQLDTSAKEEQVTELSFTAESKNPEINSDIGN